MCGIAGYLGARQPELPVGAFLSGGIDSSSIVAAAAARGAWPDTFTALVAAYQQNVRAA